MGIIGILMFITGYFGVIYISDHKVEGRYTKGYYYTKRGFIFLAFYILIIGIGIYLFIEGGI